MRHVIGLCCLIVFAGWLGCKSQEPLPPEPIELEAQPQVHEEVLPAPPPPPKPTVLQPPAPAAITYVVKPGDTLYSLAGRFYGDSKLWRLIYDANRDRIPSPQLMKAGTELRIPPKP